MFPFGRARLATRPGFLGRPDRRHRRRHDDVHLQTDQQGGEAREPVVLPFRPSGRNCDVPTFHIAELAEALAEGVQNTSVGRGARQETADQIDLVRLLGLGSDRRGKESAGQGADERPPVHYSIT